MNEARKSGLKQAGQVSGLISRLVPIAGSITCTLCEDVGQVNPGCTNQDTLLFLLSSASSACVCGCSQWRIHYVSNMDGYTYYQLQVTYERMCTRP